MKASLLFVLVVLGVCAAQLEVFLEAFPNGDLDALDAFRTEDAEAVEMETRSEYSALDALAACPTIPLPADTNNVRNLKPGNIKVLLAMGDSITAGMGAKDTNVAALKEYRGLAFPIGSDAGVSTFPNILKLYTATGYPLGVSSGVGTRTSAGNGLNAAVSGAINSDLLPQAQWLVTQLKANTKINLANDWKVLTIWMGSNNLCAVCNNDAANNGVNFENNLIAALNHFYTNVPRLFVNLVSNLDISTLYSINTGTCGLLHTLACSCVGSSNAANRAKVAAAAQDYMARAVKIAKSYNDRNNTGFAVVAQPFLTKNIITDRSLLSAADCFHPSAAGHALASVALWNNMLTPAAQKKTTWGTPADQPICPTAASIFPTN